MKILKYTKLKNNKYRVDFECESLEIYDDLIIKYELLLKKKLKEEEFGKATMAEAIRMRDELNEKI